MLGRSVRVDLDDGEIGELVRADQLGVHDAAIVECDLDLGCALDHVVVGDDVTVGRNDDAGADAVLNLLRLLHTSASLTLAGHHRAEELGKSGRQLRHLLLLVLGVLIVTVAIVVAAA